ncbi:MAG: TIGR03617 family F420-dependent LLM class oxidoreductase [Chloroflexi bacterium]|nr:TIGR03617 family F420-dependent LLM class oxidoreductase [Chloroflexota bacterium]
MHFDAALFPPTLSDYPALARAAEGAGIDAVWTTETQHHPFLPFPLVAEHTTRLRFGTAIAIGFARSPMTLAQAAWDLAAMSGGRLLLGLGTQVKPHIERRFSMPWPESPVGKLRELIQALRAIWSCWQSGPQGRVNFRGEYYKITLMSPFFNPGPISHPDIPILIAGVNTGLARLAGALCQGYHVHPYHSVSYIREVVLPAIEAGAQSAGRGRADLQLVTSAFVFSDASEAEEVRRQISFYASTPTYRTVMEHHGWGETAARLTAHAARGEWAEMPKLISDPMLETFALSAPPAEMGQRLRQRYEGLLDRVALYRPFDGQNLEEWQRLGQQVRGDGGR